MTDSGYQYFSIGELSCKGNDCCGGQEAMNPEFMGKIVSLRRSLGFPFVITNAYRCNLHNERVSSTGPNGIHTTGHAIDIAVSYSSAAKLLEAAIKSGHFTGIGISQKGPANSRFIHLDDGREALTIWTY